VFIVAFVESLPEEIIQTRKWILNQEIFDKLLAQFDSDINRAGEKYESVRAGIIKYFQCRGCAPALELADETIDRVACKVAEGVEIREGSFFAYFYGVARNVFHEHLRSRDRDQSTIESLPARSHPSEDPMKSAQRRTERTELERRLACLEACVNMLPPKARKMMLSYYEEKEGTRIRNRRRLAEVLGVDMNGLRLRVHRVREKLEACLIHCLAQPPER
jgi:RNA polymerase sigma factor (sigma-70 family)